MTEILFVCTGNTCRSPMAEYLLRDWVGKAGFGNLTVRSAGLFTRDGDVASIGARFALDLLGVSLQPHRSRLVALPMMEQADWVLGMTRAHKRELAKRFPGHSAKFYTLGEFIQEPELEIADPFGQSGRIYQQTAWQLQALVKKILDCIERTDGV